MPLGKIEIDSILGLTTNRNETSGINAPTWSSMSSWAVENSSSGATNPNTLQDCLNITISRNKQAAARTTFAEVWDFVTATPTYYGSDQNFTTVGIYPVPNSAVNSLQFVWINGTTANIANFTDSVDEQMQSCVNVIGTTTYTNVFTSLLYLLPDFSWQVSASPEFITKSFNIAHFGSSYNNIYVFSSNGVFRTVAQYIPNVTVSNYNQYKKVILPVVNSLSAQITASPTDASRWFPSGYLVNIKVVLTDQLSLTQVYQGKPSRTLTIANTGTESSIQLTFAVNNININILSGGVAVYRTISYLPSDLAPPTKFYKCYEASLSAGANSSGSTTTTFSNVELILNDTSIQGFAQIYTSLDVEGGTAQSAESAAPPTARDVVNYNNFTVYGNVMCPPFAPLTMTALPNLDNLDFLKVGATTVPITYIPNSTTPPANDGVISAVNGTYAGMSSTPNGGLGYNIVIRPQDPAVTTGTATPASYSVAWYAIAQTLALAAGGTGATQTINITPKPGELFDITRFPPTGIVAVVRAKVRGYVVALFSYQSFTQDPTMGFYVFSNCLAYGVPFTDLTWTGAAGGGLPTAGTYVLYALAGTSVTALSVYAIGSNATGYSSEVGFSLEPTYDLYTTRQFNQIFVGKITSVTQVTPSIIGTPWQPVVASIDFRGIYAQNSGDLLDQTTRTLCDAYNNARVPEDPYAVYVDSTTAPVGQIRFESLFSGYARQSLYANNSAYTNGLGFYDAIKAQVYRTDGSAPTVQFAEPIVVYKNGASTPSNIMQQVVQTVAGMTASKLNKPEEIPIGQNLTPTIVGDPLKPIIKLVNQYNQLLIFKQNEGTYRVDMQGGGAEGLLPVFNILTLIDNTAWLLLPESVQEFEGTVIYFSNKAFATISSAGQVAEVSPTIATELLNEYTTIYNNGDIDKVRSWVITQQRLYCCYFPHVNEDKTSSTYVFSFNTGQWTKWSGEIVDAAVSATGLLSLTENIYGFEEPVDNTADIQINSLDLTNRYWIVMRQADFQSPSETQVEDNISLVDFTVTQDIGADNILIVIKNFNTNSVYGNLYKLLSLYKNRTIWYLNQTLGYVPTVLYSTNFSDSDPTQRSITLLVVDNSYDQIPSSPTDFNPAFQATNADFIVTTVNTSLYFNKFFIANPRGSTISHYNEVQLYTQEGESYSNLAIGFNSTGQDSDLVITTTNLYVVTTSGSYVTLDTTLYEQFTPYYVLAQSQYAFRVLVPLNAGRGRFIQLAILHDTPNEVFILNSIVYIYRELNSTKIRAHS